MARIAVVPGDGVGPEVVREAAKVLKVAGGRFGIPLEFEQGTVGGAAIDRLGTPLPPETWNLCKSSDRKSTRLNSNHGYISYTLFFFNDPAPTETSPLSLHDALPISSRGLSGVLPSTA